MKLQGILFSRTNGFILIRFEVSTAMTIKNAVFWNVTLCGSYNNQSFGGTIAPIIRVTRIGELGTTLAVTSK
jgi:hypothetical protein